MPGRVIFSSKFSSPASPFVLLDEFASIGRHRNATTATALTSARGTVGVSFDLVEPPAISRWFVDFSGQKEREFKRKPQILNADDSLVLLRMAVFPEDDGGLTVDYFVYRAGPAGKPSLDLIPGPHPKMHSAKQIGVLHFGDDEREHYAVVFPAPRPKASMAYEMHMFSSETQAWSTKVAKVVIDRETGCHDIVRHRSSKVVSAGGSWLAWIDLWRGVLLCNVLDEDPVLKLLQWPVPPPEGVCIEMYAARSIRDAAVSDAGVVREVKLEAIEVIPNYLTYSPCTFNRSYQVKFSHAASQFQQLSTHEFCKAHLAIGSANAITR
ncbi:hypothetical protein HU200_023119 [Digitaria exilis]|uniref:DUF1618 domain-containing protein n=1 Tax=Digitaria exilis TaxID=1010633 RepID=A0A835C5T3_9POAL|nr:hypothetical protein HU200_023119 [Digitaria exilis]